MKFAARRVAAESKRGAAQDAGKILRQTRVLRNFCLTPATCVSGEFFFTSGARRAQRRRSVAGQQRGEKNESREALANLLGVGGGF